MKIKNSILALASLLITGMLALSSCESGRSYAELLTDEDQAVNRFLANQRVILDIPADSVFEVGENAPYYRLDNEGNIYMQVLNPGYGSKATENQLIYFRYTRYYLSSYRNSLSDVPSDGNINDVMTSRSFRYQNYTLPSSAQYGTGIQTPLNFLPLNCEVNLVVKSQYGFTSEMSAVQPFLYHIRYYKSMI